MRLIRLDINSKDYLHHNGYTDGLTHQHVVHNEV